jgi:hypothetical protein
MIYYYIKTNHRPIQKIIIIIAFSITVHASPHRQAPPQRAHVAPGPQATRQHVAPHPQAPTQRAPTYITHKHHGKEPAPHLTYKHHRFTPTSYLATRNSSHMGHGHCDKEPTILLRAQLMVFKHFSYNSAYLN